MRGCRGDLDDTQVRKEAVHEKHQFKQIVGVVGEVFLELDIADSLPAKGRRIRDGSYNQGVLVASAVLSAPSARVPIRLRGLIWSKRVNMLAGIFCLFLGMVRRLSAFRVAPSLCWRVHRS